MTTPREPRPSIRGGSLPRDGDDSGDDDRGSNDPARRGAGSGAADERWTPDERYVVERRPRGDRDPYLDQAGSSRDREPGAHRAAPVWASARLAAILGSLLIGLVVLAVVVPGLGRPAASAPPPPPSVVPSAVAAAPSAATPSPSPSPSPVASPTPLPSVLEVPVRSGDSLTSIALQYDTKARSIAFWNRDRYPSLDPQAEDYAPDQIQVGWTLVVYPGQLFAEPDLSSPSPSAPSGEPSDSTAPSG